MDNNKAMAASATMVALAALASGAFFVSSSQAASTVSNVVPEPAPVVVEYIDANGIQIGVPTTYESVMVDAATNEPAVASAALGEQQPVADAPPYEAEYDEAEYDEEEYEDEDGDEGEEYDDD